VAARRDGSTPAAIGAINPFRRWLSMPWWLFPSLMVVYGGFAIVFAIRPPGGGVGSWFKVPILFALLPGEWGLRVGRLTMGLLCIAFGVWLGYTLQTTM
jgi:hypothetical protein